MTQRSGSPTWFWLTAALFGLLSVSFLIWLTVFPSGSGWGNPVDDLGELLAALIAGGASLLAASRVERRRRAWRLLAASSFAWAAGEAVWCYYDLFRSDPLPFPSLADVGFLAAIPLAVVALRSLPGRPASEVSELGGRLGRILVGVTVSLFVWTTVLGVFDGVPFHVVLQRVVGLAYPVGDVVIVTVVAMAARRERRQRTALALVLGGLLAITVADTSFGFMTAAGTYGAGNPADTGWLLGYLLIALGALWTCANPASDVRDVGRPIVAPKLRLATAPATVLSADQSEILLVALQKPLWLTKAKADQMVYAGSLVLLLADLSICLYDVVQLLKMA